jgi:hypothetical protein
MSEFPRTVDGHPRWTQKNDWVYEHESKMFLISRSLSFADIEGVDPAQTKHGHWVYDAWHGTTKSAESPAIPITQKSVHCFGDAVAAVVEYAKKLKSTQQQSAASTTEGVSAS